MERRALASGAPLSTGHPQPPKSSFLPPKLSMNRKGMSEADAGPFSWTAIPQIDARRVGSRRRSVQTARLTRETVRRRQAALNAVAERYNVTRLKMIAGEYVSSAATPTVDWLHQVLWFVAGVFATGAIWYFAGQKNWLATLWSTFAAVVTSLLAITLLIRNDLIRRAATPVRAEVVTSDDSSDRRLTLEQSNYLTKSLEAFVEQPVVVSFVIGDPDSQVFAEEIAQTLTNCRWNVKRLVALPLTYRGVRMSVQDPTDVPRAAEALIRAFADQGIEIDREYVQPSAYEYVGVKYVPVVYVNVGRRGRSTPVPPRYAVPLVVPKVPTLPPKLAKVKPRQLAGYAAAMAIALRDYELNNRRRFESEWRLHDEPLPADSYRGVFERSLRPTARLLRDEMERRLRVGPTVVWALDGDSLDGPSPLRDAASYLAELAKRLQPHP